MKTNDIKELRTKTLEELKTLVKENRDTLFNIKMEIMKNKEKNLRQISHKKDDIARILTIIKEKEVEKGGSA